MEKKDGMEKTKQQKKERRYWKRVLATALRNAYPNIGISRKEFTSISM
jgi:ribosomal protein L22